MNHYKDIESCIIGIWLESFESILFKHLLCLLHIGFLEITIKSIPWKFLENPISKLNYQNMDVEPHWTDVIMEPCFWSFFIILLLRLCSTSEPMYADRAIIPILSATPP